MSLSLGNVLGFTSALESEDGIIIACYGPGRSLIYISKSVETILGIKQSELIGNSKYTLYPSGTSFYTRKHTSGRILPMETVVWSESQDGSVFTIERLDCKFKNDSSLDSSSSNSSHSTPVFEVTAETDLNDMKDFSEAMIMKDFIEKAPMPAYSVTRDGKIRWANKAMLKMMGYLDAPHEFVGSHTHSCRLDRDSLQERAEIRSGDMPDVPCALRWRDVSTIHVCYNSNAYMDESGALLYTRCIPCDMTVKSMTRKENDESARARIAEAEKRAQAAQEASKVKSAFIATVSHEIRTPINGVIGMAALLNMTNLSEEQQESVDTIVASADMLLSLIGNVLDVTKIESGKFELNLAPFDLSRVVHKTWEVMKYKATKHNVDFTVDVSPELEAAYFVGDANRITQILLNFLSNALKFTDKGSVSCSASRIGTTDSCSEDVIRLEVVDTGIGIEDCSGLFAPYVQADRSVYADYGGTGLGLSISRQLVTLMGGTVGIFSDGVHGHGTRVWADIPLRKQTNETSAALTAASITPGVSCSPSTSSARSPVPADVDNRPRILVVDDNKVNRKIAFKMLSHLSYHSVDLVADGQEAVDTVMKAWSVGKPYDIIFMDCLMPVMDGWEATQRIREFERGSAGQYACHDRLRDDTVVLALTAMVTVEDKEKSMLIGMDDFLTKPLTIDALDETVRSWTNRIVL